MIFLFFGSSIAHLEPELQRFEDQSIFDGISAARAGFGWDWPIFKSLGPNPPDPVIRDSAGQNLLLEKCNFANTGGFRVGRGAKGEGINKLCNLHSTPHPPPNKKSMYQHIVYEYIHE